MLSQIAYVRQQIHHAQRAGTPSARADHLQRALEGLARVESQAQDALLLVDLMPECDPFLPMPARELMEDLAPVANPCAVVVGPGGEELLAREG